MGKNFTLLFLLLSFGFGLSAQNLVPNESFEKFLVCPKRIDHVRQLYISNWQQATAGSIDYFHACSITCGTPHNAAGTQNPKTGEAYIGMYCYKGNYREYAQAKLRSPLKAGVTYYIGFSVCLAEISGLAIDRIGATITKSKINSRVENVLECLKIEKVDGQTKKIKTTCKQQASNSLGNILSDTKGWVTISGTFVAKGGEEYITIGNFYNTEETSIEKVNPEKDESAYYFIDDVIVNEGTSPVAISYTPPTQKTERKEVPGELLTKVDTQKETDGETKTTVVSRTSANKSETTSQQPIQVSADDYFEQAAKGETKTLPKTPIVLDNIFFAPNDYTILEESQSELLKLVSFMNKNENVRIEISGHTDDTGTALFNMELSENRAKAVFNFLVMEDIDPGRLSYKGYGNSKAISTDGTEEGKKKNRRVEFKIVGQ